MTFIRQSAGRASAVLHDTTDSPLALYQFDGDLTDTSGNGGPTLAKRAGGTELYSGANDPSALALNLKNDTQFQSGVERVAYRLIDDLTIEMLIKSRGQDAGTGVLCSYRIPGGANTYWQISYGSTGTVRFIYDIGASDNVIESTTVAPVDSDYTHIAVTRDRIAGAPDTFTIKVFINGELVITAVGETVTSITPDTTERLLIGGYDDSLHFDGVISSLRIYDSVRSDADVLADAKATNPQYFGL